MHYIIFKDMEYILSSERTQVNYFKLFVTTVFFFVGKRPNITNFKPRCHTKLYYYIGEIESILRLPFVNFVGIEIVMIVNCHWPTCQTAQLSYRS